MGISPLELERAPRSRVLRWLYFWSEQSSYESYMAESAAARAARGG